MDVKESILKFLTLHNTMTLATVRDNLPYAASLFYANDGFNLYFVSSLNSRHSLNIDQIANVSVTINKDYSDSRMWKSIKGLQISGKAHLVPSQDVSAVKNVYFEKYPFAESIFRDRNVGSQNVGSQSADFRFFDIVPESIRLIDNETAFGYKQEISL